MANDQDSGGAGDDQNAGAKPITIGDKNYTVEDLTSIIAESGNATQALQQAAVVEGMAARYNMPVAEFLRQTEGSFAAVADLMEQGVIDATGKVVQKAAASGDDDGDFLTKLLGGTGQQAPAQQQQQQQQASAPSTTEAAVIKALQKFSLQLESASEKIARLEGDNSALIRANLSAKVQGKFPDLNEDGVNLVLTRAQADRSKNLMGHAEAIMAERTQLKAQGQAELAKQLGIEDLEAHLNQLKQQDPAGGPGVQFEGKKISFNTKDPKAVHPRDAAKAFLDRAFER